MKYLFVCLLLIPFLSFGQYSADLDFDKPYFECEDKWVTFPKNDTDSVYVLGFISLDEEAGFTFDLQGRFKVTATQEYIKTVSYADSASVKIRLEPNTNLVAILPKEKLKMLDLPLVPEWLKYYKSDNNSVESLVRRGYHFNHVGASDIAIENLEKAYKIEQHAEGLEFELSYAYNATKQFQKAITVLKKAIENDAENYFFYRELGFSYAQLQKIEKADKIYTKGIKLSDDDYQKSEMAINMAYAYYMLKDKSKFKKWAKITKKYAKDNTKFLEHIQHFENTIND